MIKVTFFTNNDSPSSVILPSFVTTIFRVIHLCSDKKKETNWLWHRCMKCYEMMEKLSSFFEVLNFREHDPDRSPLGVRPCPMPPGLRGPIH